MGFDNENAVMSDLVGKPWMVFDIETCPMPNCGEYLTDPIEAPANYKDPLKIAAFISEKRQKQIDDAALDLDLCEVVAIGWVLPNHSYVQTREEYSEAEMLDGFWRFVRTIQRENGSLVGFNCLSFDLPILLRRSLYLGVEAPRISLDRYRHDGVIDVLDVLNFGRREFTRSLSFYCKRFDIPHDTSVDGSQIPQLVAEQKWAQVASHAKSDAEATTALARRLGLIWQLQPVEPAEAVA